MRAFAAAAVLVLAAGAAQAQDRPNFAGTWELDAANSTFPTGASDGADSSGRAAAGRDGRGPDGRGGRGARGGGLTGRGPGPGAAAVDGRARARGRGLIEAPNRVVIRQTPISVTIGQNTYAIEDPLNPDAAAAASPLKARWDGNKLLIESVRDFRGTNVITREVRTLNGDGSRMTVDITMTSPQGETRSTQIFNKR